MVIWKMASASVVKPHSIAFRKFNQDALDCYVGVIKKKHGVAISLKDVPDLPPICKMLAGEADAIGENPKGDKWVVMVKKVWSPSFSPPKTVEEIAQTRENFYIMPCADGKRWKVRENTAVWYACQNVLMMLRMDLMDLVLFNERNNDVLVVTVQKDVEDFRRNMFALQQYFG